jgi:F-type H+-transporting ATPase subunit epsilon
MAELVVKIVTPERSILTGKALSLSAPSVMGEVTILPGHDMLLAEVGTGSVAMRTLSGTQWFVVSGGFIEVEGNHVSLLVESAEAREELDRDRARAAKKDAEKQLKNLPFDGEDYCMQKARLDRAEARLHVLDHT